MEIRKHLPKAALVLVLLTAAGSAQVKKIQMKVGGHLCAMCSFNIRKSVSLLEFGPKLDDVKVIDLSKGLCAFTPKANAPVSFATLKAMLKKSGFKLISAEITVSGRPSRDESGSWIEAASSSQRFALTGEDVNQVTSQGAGADIEVTGDWQTVGQKDQTREVIQVRGSHKTARFRKDRGFTKADLDGIQVSLAGVSTSTNMFAAPIRATSPGLSVYKGGELSLRYSYTQLNLDDLKVLHHMFRIGFSYTPTPKLQLEVDLPYHAVGENGGEAHSPGNTLVWAKYRFFNSLEEGGDRQASLRFGIELPTADKNAFRNIRGTAPEFVRRQFLQIPGGLAGHLTTAFAKAKGKWIVGGNIETIYRSEFQGFRMGHEAVANTDLEYALLPVKYKGANNELRLILETTYSARLRGRLNGQEVPGTSASEFFVAPGLQFAVTPRFVIEASYQHPVVQNTGPLVLREVRNVLVGVRYMY